MDQVLSKRDSHSVVQAALVLALLPRKVLEEISAQ
jgi:hypothetical protein